MDLNSRRNAFALGALGCILIAFYFWAAPKFGISRLLFQPVSKEEILQKAEDLFTQSSLADFNLSRKVEIKLDSELLQFAQTTLRDDDKFVPLGQWQVTWRGKIQSKDGEEDVSFRVNYDFQGNLVELDQVSKGLNRPPNFDEPDARAFALRFLADEGVDTSRISMRSTLTNQDDRTLRYDFLYSRPSPISPQLKENYNVKIVGRNIKEYEARTLIDESVFSFSELEKKFRIPAIASTVLIWALISLILLGVFLKRLRHDVLEFKRAFWYGAVIGVLVWLAFVIDGWPSWEAILISGGVAGLVSGAAILLIFSTAESLSREVWPNRVALLDSVLSGSLRVRELGMAILNSLFLAGVTLLFFVAIFYLDGKSAPFYLSVDTDVLAIVLGQSAFIANIIENFVFISFVGLTLFFFWLTYLRSRIARPALLILLLGLFINLAGLHFYYLRPSYLSFILFMPVAFLWGYSIFRLDLIAVLLALFLTHSFLELPLLGSLANGFTSLPGISIISLITVLFLSGAYFVKSKKSIADFSTYVPEYVSRIAQRERFLKELEIARSVQMRFLPQSNPELPNLDVASICRPAYEVGGDYYDFILNGDRSLGVILGDVSGKGVSAAFYMTMVKGIVKTLTKTRIEPKDILTEMNSIFYENAPRDVFISMVYGLFEPDKGNLTFARAGHNPIIVRKRNHSESQMLNSKGLAIGLDRGSVFSVTIEQRSIPIESGDVFVFFTDGITESMNKKGQEFGEERLLKVIYENSDASANAILDKITETVNSFSTAESQHDDFTMVVVKVN